MDESKKIDPKSALDNLYKAARLASLNAESHEIVVQSAVSLQNFINSFNTPVRTSELLELPKEEVSYDNKNAAKNIVPKKKK